jgi:hypothetical protein
LEGLATLVDRQQIGDEFAGHGQRGAVAMSAFQFAGDRIAVYVAQLLDDEAQVSGAIVPSELMPHAWR